PPPSVKMIHRECGVLKTSYEADMALYPLPIARWTMAVLGAIFFLLIPLTLHEYYLSVANLVWIAVIGAIGLNILVGYTGQVSIEVPRPRLGSMVLSSQRDMYYFLLVFVVLAIVGALNLVRSRVGRAFIAIRDQDIAAEIIGINIFRYKLLAFAISSFYAGVTGVVYTYFLGIANYEQFQLVVSVDYLAMIIIRGLGWVQGSIIGAFFITRLSIVDLGLH